MYNLGKANIFVELLNGLPGVFSDHSKNEFEISAHDWNTIKTSPFFPPMLIEQVQASDDSFAACYPSKRKLYINNYMKDEKGSSPETLSEFDKERVAINFYATTKQEGIAKTVFEDYDVPEPIITGTEPQPNYEGPNWQSIPKEGLAIPNDLFYMKQWKKWLKIEESEEEGEDLPETFEIDKTYFINQQTVKEGLFWAIESEDFLRENMPFWINLNIMQSPATKLFPTSFIISLGLDDRDNSFDIFLTQNNTPQIVDYIDGRSSDTPPEIIPFDSDLSRILDSDKEIEIGIMTIAGRLVVSINKVNMIYTRYKKPKSDQNPDDVGTLREAKISSGKVRISGSNVQATINVSPMIFAPLSIMAFSIPTIIRENNQEQNLDYRGIKNDGTYSGSVCEMKTPPDEKQTNFGVDCSRFFAVGGGAEPSGFGHHKLGEIGFNKAKNVGINSLPSCDFYVLAMRPSNTEFTAGGSDELIPYGGCPYFFRLAGGYKKEVYSYGSGPVTRDVISVSISSSCPDYFHATSNATVELYNKGGAYDYLRTGQHGIRINMGWGNVKRVFTGIINGASTSSVPGKETISLQCVDYMQILKDSPIVNSPFYDGMVAVNAIEDISKRAGILSFIKDWESEKDYFLPSGYSFSKPLVRFESTQSLFDCMISIIKRFEAFAYFDSDGKFHVNKLPGGLFSEVSGDLVAFVSDPNSEDVDKIILNEKNIEYCK